jgi:hypothetical protein
MSRLTTEIRPDQKVWVSVAGWLVPPTASFQSASAGRRCARALLQIVTLMQNESHHEVSGSTRVSIVPWQFRWRLEKLHIERWLESLAEWGVEDHFQEAANRHRWYLIARH